MHEPIELSHVVTYFVVLYKLSCIVFMDPMEDQLGHVDRAE